MRMLRYVSKFAQLADAGETFFKALMADNCLSNAFTSALFAGFDTLNDDARVMKPFVDQMVEALAKKTEYPKQVYEDEL